MRWSRIFIGAIGTWPLALLAGGVGIVFGEIPMHVTAILLLTVYILLVLPWAMEEKEGD